MRNKILILFFGVVLIINLTELLAYEPLKVEILPGCGLILDKDSILIGKTNLLDFINKYKSKYNLPNDVESVVVFWDGYDTEKKQDIGGSYYESVIKIKSIEFTFCSPDSSSGTFPNDYNKFDLTEIFITNLQGMMITLDKVELTEPNPRVLELFPSINSDTDISSDSLEYYLYNNGITFILQRLNTDIFIETIKIYKPYRKEKNKYLVQPL